MKILLVSDHENKYIWDHFDASRFADIDLILSSGDLKSEYLSFLVTMINKPLFYIHGNHDTEYISKPPEGCEAIEDRIVQFKGIRILGLGGCMKYCGYSKTGTKPFQYTDREMQKRIRRLRIKLMLKGGFDILLTHAPVKGICDGADLCHTGFPSLLALVDRWKPAYVIHGHMHMGFGRGKRFVMHGDTKVIDAFDSYILEL